MAKKSGKQGTRPADATGTSPAGAPHAQGAEVHAELASFGTPYSIMIDQINGAEVTGNTTPAGARTQPLTVTGYTTDATSGNVKGVITGNVGGVNKSYAAAAASTGYRWSLTWNASTVEGAGKFMLTVYLDAQSSVSESLFLYFS